MRDDHPDEKGTPGDLTPHHHFLIVEDDTELAGLLARWVNGHYGDRVDVHIAHSIEAGIQLLGELSQLDVVLLDRHFPQGTGEDILDTLHQRFDPIVVMITGIEPNTELIRFPVADYFVKPIDRSALIKRLSLLEKLAASGSLEAYTNARKASLLEFHLDDPDADPLFRRFAARWSYDRIEVAATVDTVYVYELYVQDDSVETAGVNVAIIGTLVGDLSDIVDRGELVPIGELVETANGHAWIDIDRNEVVEPPSAGYVVYEFTGDLPEQFVAAGEVTNQSTIERELEQAYA